MSNGLKEITFNVMKELKNYDIILPADYANTFKSYAKQLNIEIEDQDELLKEVSIDNNKINDIVKNTGKNLDLLNESAQEAQVAIENKDNNKLKTIKDDISLLQEQVSILQKQLFSDSLTGANNRKWLMDNYLNEGIFENNGYLCFIDLNNFKKINDNYGHLIGDMVLKYLTTYLKNEIKFKDSYIIRYAGDEFIVLFDTDEKTNKFDKIMQDTQEKLSKQVLKPKNDKKMNLSFSFSYGITAFKKGENFNDKLEISDKEMYQNKIKVKKKYAI